jgi:prevent-host-death family protein
MMVVMVTSKGRQAWQVAEAKAKLSELLADAATHPQVIERRGTPVAVVLGIEAYAAANAQLIESSVESRMARFLEHCAALRGRGGVVLRVGRRVSRPSPFEES